MEIGKRYLYGHRDEGKFLEDLKAYIGNDRTSYYHVKYILFIFLFFSSFFFSM